MVLLDVFQGIVNEIATKVSLEYTDFTFMY